MLRNPIIYNTEKYHTDRPTIRMREYGRYTQNLVRNAVNIKDRELRQSYIEKIIELIMDMYPTAKSTDDYRLKIWSHILQMADYELDVDIPDSVPRQKIEKHPEKVAYPSGRIAIRYYGKNINAMIAKAVALEPGEKQAEFIRTIAAYMKISYKTWSLGEITDEQVASDLERLSEGRLIVAAESNLDYLEQTSRNKRPTGHKPVSAVSNNRRNNQQNSAGYSNSNSGNKPPQRRNNPNTGRDNNPPTGRDNKFGNNNRKRK